MGGPPTSQVAPLPSNLPFRLISKTIGCGAYASIRKAIPHHSSGPVIAVKFINKDHAYSTGRLRAKQLQIELSLHSIVCPHDNIIRYLAHGTDDAWVWMALELAEGGDLFDKIEADEGVGEDVAHFYFTQLCAAIGWCHAKGIAHRDVKPENMLLSGAGDLKLADFGLATKFVEEKTGQRKSCGMVCGSPPYIAPEILKVGDINSKRKGGSGGDKIGYDPEPTDVWSCAIVLFVLLAGNTPWDKPVMAESYEFHEFVTSKGRPNDELWNKVPAEALSLVRGLLKVEPNERFGMSDVRKHPWFTRRNPHLNDKGKVANPVTLATQMLESLRIDFSASQQDDARTRAPGPPLTTNTTTLNPDAMDLDPRTAPNFSSTQPEPPIPDPPFDWEAPPRLGAHFSASQPTSATSPTTEIAHPIPPATQDPTTHLSHLSQDPSMSQFTPQPSLPLTLTQAARHFNDILPSHTLARFCSTLPFSQLLPLLTSALHGANVPVASPGERALRGEEAVVSLRVKTVDARKQTLQGVAVVERMDEGLLEVRFLKAKGDPLGWRRLFKRVVVGCRDGVFVPRT